MPRNCFGSRDSAKLGRFGPMLSDDAISWAGVGKPDGGQQMANIRAKSTSIGNLRQHIGGCWPTMANILPSSVNIGQIRQMVDRCWLEPTEYCRTLAESGRWSSPESPRLTPRSEWRRTSRPLWGSFILSAMVARAVAITRCGVDRGWLRVEVVSTRRRFRVLFRPGTTLRSACCSVTGWVPVELASIWGRHGGDVGSA